VLTFMGPYAGPIVAAFLAGPIVFCFGWLVHRFIMSRVTGAGVEASQGGGAYGQILTTLGLSLILQNGGLIVFGSTPTAIRTPLSRSSFEIGEVLLNRGRCVSFVVSVLVAAAVYLFLSHTRLGKGLRAAADNPRAAIYMGIDVDRAHRIAWSLGVGITAIAGGLVATFQTFQPYIGFDFVIVMYAGVVLGGLGSNIGAFWGGLVIGIVQQMATLVLPYQLQNTAIFIVFLLIIFLRPQGMFGRLTERT
jgi:branched-chain amino acid transport system permease protein